MGPNFKSARRALRSFSVEHSAYASNNLQTERTAAHADTSLVS